MTTGEFAVLAIVALTADNKTGACSPAVGTVAKGAKMAYHGTRVALGALERAGWLHVEKRQLAGKKGTGNDTHVITLLGHVHDDATCERCSIVRIEGDGSSGSEGVRSSGSHGSDRQDRTPSIVRIGSLPPDLLPDLPLI